MGDDRVGRRAILGGGAALLATLAGCGRLFIRPESTTTPPGRPTATETPTSTPAPTPAGTPGGSPTPTAAPLAGAAIEVSDRQFSVETSPLEKFTHVDYRFGVENVDERAVALVEFRVDARYEHGELSRVVGTDYPRVRFDADGDGDGDAGGAETRRGLQPDEADPIRGRVRFERDGRAERSTDASRFSLELSLRRLRYR